MRIAPVGVRFSSDPERLVEEARRSAQVTMPIRLASTVQSHRRRRSVPRCVPTK
jgi:hypothetical protein